MSNKSKKQKITNALKDFTQNIMLLLENVIEDKLLVEFGDNIYSKKYNYELNMKDLLVIQRILSQELFDKKLDLLPISIISEDYAKMQNDYPFKGRIGHDFISTDGKSLKIMPIEIQIVSYGKHDNLMKIVEVVAHELIHQYDYLYGQAKFLLPIEKHMKAMGIAFDKYDVHGMYFKNQMNRINKQFDLAVEITYNEENMNFMKHKNKSSMPIEIRDATSNKLDENDQQKKELKHIAKYLSTAFINDGSVSIEMHDDAVRVWTI